MLTLKIEKAAIKVAPKREYKTKILVMEYVLKHDQAEVIIKTGGNGKNHVSVKIKADVSSPASSCETNYPVELIEKILGVKGPSHLCDEILRDESPSYVQKCVSLDVFGYIGRKDFENKRVLDFGCGSGASTVVLSRSLPHTKFIGVDIEESLLEIATSRVKFYNLEDRVRLLVSPDGESLPDDIGSFDFIFLNAVYEHLLPAEREHIFPLLWQRLNPGGVLFINQTPYRWFPIESHTTGGLIFLNYLPDFIASIYARRISKRNLENYGWSTLLRMGIRGGSVNEIFRILRKEPFQPILLTPEQLRFRDRIDLWRAATNSRFWFIKKCMFYLFKLIKITTGFVFLPTLSLAIKKAED